MKRALPLFVFLSLICTQNTLAEPAAQPGFWPEAPGEPRVQFLVSYASGADVEPGSKLTLDKPYGVAMRNGRIYVVEIRSKSVTILDLQKKQVRSLAGDDRTPLTSPVDIALADDGSKYVADTAGSVVAFDADDRLTGSFPLADARPVGLAVHKDLLYVADFMSQSVKVIDRKTTKETRTIGSKGSEDGQFVQPLKVAIDRHGNVRVVDIMRCRIQAFDPDGKLLSAFGETGNQPGNFVRPKHLAVVGDGLAVVDAAMNNVQLFDERNKVTMWFGGPGPHRGAMNLPAGICVGETKEDLEPFKAYVDPAFDAQKVIVVTNQFGDAKVSVYALGRLREGKTRADLKTAPIATQPAK